LHREYAVSINPSVASFHIDAIWKRKGRFSSTRVYFFDLRSILFNENRVLRLCLEERFTPLMGAALLAEYEDLLGRESIWRGARLTATERETFLDIFLSICRWTRIYYAWRPNLGDEADNHLMELAVAGQADYLVTRNVRDLRGGELKFPGISVVTPAQLLKEQE
jgi:predicted nucleic acid-binding protein